MISAPARITSMEACVITKPMRQRLRGQRSHNAATMLSANRPCSAKNHGA